MFTKYTADVNPLPHMYSLYAVENDNCEDRW